MSRLAAAAIAVTTVVVTAGAARAQSTRYPPPPRDPDAEADAHSAFWEAASQPGLARYRDLVRQAVRLIEQRDPDPVAQAESLLVEATGMVPDRPAGWWYLGVAREAREDWAGCSDAYLAAWKLDRDFVGTPPLRADASLDLALGVCLARAGRLEDARHHLQDLTRTGRADAEVLLRLGEVDMALGRLADAVDVLGRAAEDATISADVHWALAVAYDRARRGTQAEDELAIALRLDPTLTRVAAPRVPYLSEAELYYYQGLAATAAGVPERALVYFRQFEVLAAKSPWRSRADQHIADLAATDWSARLTMRGTARVDAGRARAALHAGWPRLEACVHHRPGLLVMVRITELGTQAGALVRGTAQAGARATAYTSFGVDDDQLAKTLACIESAAATLKLPRPLQRYGFTTLSFPVVAD